MWQDRIPPPSLTAGCHSSWRLCHSRWFLRHLQGPWSLFPSGRAGSVAPGAGRSRGQTTRSRDRQGIASVWGSAEPAFVSRAHSLRVLLANPALLARPGAFPGPVWAGPAPSRSKHFATERSLLPSLSTSSTIRGVAPPLARVHPRNLGSLCSPFPSVFCRLAALGLALRRAARVSAASLLRLRAVSLGRHRVPHPQPFACDPKSGSRVLTPPPHPSADSRARGPASHSRRPRSARRPPPPSLLRSRSPGTLTLALSKASALPARALRALASPGSCQCGDCAGKHGDRGNDPH